MVKYCPQCGAPNQDDAKFCIRCGYQFPQEEKFHIEIINREDAKKHFKLSHSFRDFTFNKKLK